MKETRLTRLSDRYLTALRSHFKGEPKTNLKAARTLGNQAVALGLGTLDLVKIHGLALVTLRSTDASALTPAEITARAALFFADAHLPMEETHRSAVEAGAELHQQKALLQRCTQDLAISKRELVAGIRQRKAAEKALKSSGAHSAKLIDQALQLEKELQALARQILTAQEKERGKMSHELQDEIAQSLLAIHVRLLALDKRLVLSAADSKKEIVNTQRLVAESVKTLNRFAREFGIVYEN